MTNSKTYQSPGVKVTVELEDGLTIEETCPGDNDLILFVKDRLTLHLRRKATKTVDIPEPIIDRIQKIINLGTCGYDSIQGYIEAALIKDIESTTDLMGIPNK